MHLSALQSYKDFQEAYLDKLDDKNKKKIIEIGSLSVNSNIKDIVSTNFNYIGLDIEEGPNVDIVLEDPYKLPFDDNSIDVVLSISTFEHTDFFWVTFLEILRVLKPEGLFFLNAPSNSKIHRHPSDSWRFYPDSSLSLSKWGNLKGFNCEVLEHFTNLETGIDIWNDYVSVIIKDKKFKENFPNRIISKKENFTNGRTDKSDSFINYSESTQDQNNWGWKLHYKLRKKFWKFKKLLKI